MERSIQKIKDRTECFDDDHLLCRKLIAVKTSTTLTWTNDDTLPHTVTSGNADTGPSGEFDSGIVMGAVLLLILLTNQEPSITTALCILI